MRKSHISCVALHSPGWSPFPLESTITHMFPVISGMFYLLSSILHGPGNDCAPSIFKMALRTQDFT